MQRTQDVTTYQMTRDKSPAKVIASQVDKMSGRVLNSHNGFYETERSKLDTERTNHTNTRGKNVPNKNRGREMQAVMNAPANHSMEEINELFDKPAQSLTAAGA